MKNLIPVILVICFTIFTGYLMITGEMGTDEKDDKATEQKKDAKSSKEKKEKQDSEMKINNQQDLAEIIYSKKDEKTKMDAYNQAVEKKILPRSNNYQEAVYAYEESVQIKESKSE